MASQSKIESLMEAIQEGNVVAVKHAIGGRGIDLNNPYEGELPLAAAARSGADIVKMLLDAGASVDARDGEDRTALMHAVDEGKPDCAKLLLAAGSDPNAVAGGFDCPLTYAVGHDSPEHVHVMRLLLDAGANVNIELRTPGGRPGRTVLAEAAGAGNTEAMRELIRRGADVRRPHWRGDALIDAAAGGYAEAVAMLLEAGADSTFRLPAEPNPRLADRAGKTAAEVAEAEGHIRIAQLIRKAAGEKPNPTRRVPSITAAWAALEAALRAENPAALRSLRPGASARDVAAAERLVGQSFPAEVRASFQLHDGQAAGPEFIESRDGPLGAEPFRLMSLAEALRNWQMWAQLLKGGEFGRHRPQPHPGVQPAWFHLGWLPFTENGGGDHHCIDLAPAGSGNCGQVILLRHDSPVRAVVSDGLAQWLTEMAESVRRR